MAFRKSTATNSASNAKKKFGERSLFEESGSDLKIQQCVKNDSIDAKYGFNRVKDSSERIGWLLNMHPTEILDEDKTLRSAVDYYFIDEAGGRFKVSYAFEPYFYVVCQKEVRQELCTYLAKKFSNYLSSVKLVVKEDLDLNNHLSGLKQTLIKLSFRTVNDLTKVKQPLLSAVRSNKESTNSTGFTELISEFDSKDDESKRNQDHYKNILDIREYDVPYHVRVSIDLKIFVGSWYSVKTSSQGPPTITKRDDMLVWPDCIVLAYDIETTKLPLKFPDMNTDQIMMISYMIDGQGFLITNRKVISEDVEDFEYTPTPEFEGLFTVFNEPDEKALLQRFFDHVIEVKPHIFVTYNGDFFDWPFLETRAGFYDLNMYEEIGFIKANSGYFLSRPSIHMDCLCWVKRDSYLPVGSQNLKAVAKAKLRYDPVELDPEEMCPLAASQPQVLANYSVSDAVATYYLYMKYVHPFIFALCTIIPMEPDEVLRKGSGSLCEALLMVQAFHANIVFPNKQETALNKLTTDGRVLDQETYVGGHVEAIESGVFRADVPCKFQLVPKALDKLIEEADRTLRFSIEEEEKIPFDQVENYDEVLNDIKAKLAELRDRPFRSEMPLIYHLDVGAMYPNIILTNRLQPSAMVDESVCAKCDFNKPAATCQRKMSWIWRGEVIPASRGEYRRIQQQLETEKFPPFYPDGPPRTFHQLNNEERAAVEKKRLQAYCRLAYKKVHVTRTEERWQTICQRENDFYVNTVLSFRDRRYEYKGLLKTAKKMLSDAQEKGDPTEIKAANAKAVLYDSLQLAHKCILNSFYGYVMRKGSRWHSMEMAGIVCYTGATIIMRAREIVEQVRLVFDPSIVEQIGRPLELDTDGIWCILPSSFPENYVFKTRHPKKSKVTVSFPGAILNLMVKDLYTNDQYHDQLGKDSLEYSVRSENSIFFEVDGPYLAMILPASKEEGKKLKKRYAVFNFDGSLAELKGFEIKRRGELQLVKIFQSSVFDAFLKGDSLAASYANAAKIADYWLDVLYSKASTMPDSELFDLISENRSMSRKLEDYGEQKSTSISTAKRLAEFLGDQMVKDAGLSCRFVISRKPDGAPVTERAIPLAIFHSEHSVKQHYLRRWLKDSSLVDFDIRCILDWDYYKERLSGTIQKIITIPAALQDIPNPVPRVQHPDWLHKKVLERNDTFKQRKITDMFSFSSSNDKRPPNGEAGGSNSIEKSSENETPDIEDIVPSSAHTAAPRKPIVSTAKRKRGDAVPREFEGNLHRSWRDVLGKPPPMGKTKEEIVEWIRFLKKKWTFQRCQVRGQIKRLRASDYSNSSKSTTIGGYLNRVQRTLLDVPWQIIQLAETSTPGLFKLWCLVDKDLHAIKLVIPRVFYVNQRTAKEAPQSKDVVWRRVTKTLPRSYPCLFLYEYSVPEDLFRKLSNELIADMSTPDIEGIYETQVPLDFKGIVQLGCICCVDNSVRNTEKDVFELKQLKFMTTSDHSYLNDESNLKYIYFYHHKSGNKSIFSLFLSASKKAHVFVVDSVASNQMPNLKTLYNNERSNILQNDSEVKIPEPNYSFEINFETSLHSVYRQIQVALHAYREAKKGPTYIAVQSSFDSAHLVSAIPELREFPLVPVHVSEGSDIYNSLDWQRVGSKTMIRRYLDSPCVLAKTFELARYFHAPVGNIPKNTSSFSADLFFARQLLKHNSILWCSEALRPDLGGHEDDDYRLVAELEENNVAPEINSSGSYSTVCVELNINALPVNTLLQAPRINELEGSDNAIAFEPVQKVSLQHMMSSSEASSLTSYDEMSRCAHAFKVIRQVVVDWLRDVSFSKNEFADAQLVHFYRWLCDPSSLLFEPALGKILNVLMQKFFCYVLSEFKRLGAIVVFANFTRLVICTRKKTVEDAVAYVNYILNNVRNKKLILPLNISFRQCWSYLLWLDTANFGGVEGPQLLPDGSFKGNDALTDSEALTEDSELLDCTSDDGPVIAMNWNIANYLSKVCGCQEKFSQVVVSFINSVYEKHQEEATRYTPGKTPIRRRLQTQISQTPRVKASADSEDAIDPVTTFVQEFVSGELTQNLFALTERIRRIELHKKFESLMKEEHSENVHLLLSSGRNKPALQFVKSVCKVLSLDSAIYLQVNKLKRDLLKLLNIGEFSPEATWTYPCVSFLLQEVICKSCNYFRNIDLCKDPHQKVENGRRVWLCSYCHSPYPLVDIEYQLVNVVHVRSMSYAVQDLQCERCSEIKLPNFSNHCTCGGKYSTLIKRDEFLLKMDNFLTIAKIYGLHLLEEYTQWILAHN